MARSIIELFSRRNIFARSRISAVQRQKRVSSMLKGVSYAFLPLDGIYVQAHERCDPRHGGVDVALDVSEPVLRLGQSGLCRHHLKVAPW